MTYTHTVAVPVGWEEAVRRTREALGSQGFGILSEIDVRAVFAAKLGIEASNAIGDYVILGACPGAGQPCARCREGSRCTASVQCCRSPRCGRL